MSLEIVIWILVLIRELVCIHNVGKDEDISGGKMVIEVSYFGWHIHSETHDLCGETSCPISTGDFVVSHSQDLPGFTPPVSHYSISIFNIYILFCFVLLLLTCKLEHALSSLIVGFHQEQSKDSGLILIWCIHLSHFLIVA